MVEVAMDMTTSTAVDTIMIMVATEADMITTTITTTITAIKADVIATLHLLPMTIITTTPITITTMIIMVMSLMEGTVHTDHTTTKEDVVEDIQDQAMVETMDTTTMEEIHTNMATLDPTIHHTTQLHHTHLHTVPHPTIDMDIIMVENPTNLQLNTKLKNTEALLPMDPATKAMRVIHNQLIQVMKIDQLIMLHRTKIIILDLINCLSFLYLIYTNST